MKDILMFILDVICAFIFGAMAGLAAYGAIFEGAWWHYGTMLICLAIATASWKDARKEKTEENGLSKQDNIKLECRWYKERPSTVSDTCQDEAVGDNAHSQGEAALPEVQTT